MSSPTSSTPCSGRRRSRGRPARSACTASPTTRVTGLIGVDKQPAGLAAVVSQEPVYDLYRYLYGDGMRRENAFLTPALYDLIDATPGPIADDPSYNVNGANDTQRPGCLAANYADQAANDDHDSAYWKARNLIPGAAGSNVPLFLTQGLTENNTVADGTAQYLQNHTGYERAWLGPWEHVRGNETDDSGRLKMGRAGWFDEVMRFYDQFLKGVDADGRRPADRGPDQRRQVARRAELAAGRLDGATRRRCAPAPTPTTAPPTRPATAPRRASGRSRRRSRTPSTCRAPGARRSTSRPRCPTPTSCSTSTTSTRTAPAPLITRQGHLIRSVGDDRPRPVVGGLDRPGRPPHRRQGRRRQRRLVGARADQADRHRERRLVLAAVPAGGARHRHDPGRSRARSSRRYLSQTVTVPQATIDSSTSPAFATP